MQSPIDYAIEQLSFRIPSQILALAFIGPYAMNNPYIQNQLSIPQAIRDQVICRRVMRDFNLLGGVVDQIPLYGLAPIELDQYRRVFQVPKDRTDGRSIIEALSLSFGSQGSYGYNLGTGMNQYSAHGEYGRGAVTDATMNVVASHSPLPQVATANVRLVGENTVLVTDIYPLAIEPYLNCRLAYTENFDGVTPNFWPFFAEMVFLATKAYIYNELVIRMDMGQLIGGQELGMIQQIVSEYADADRTYVETRDEKLGKKAFLADPGRKQRHLRMVMGGCN